MKSFIAEDSFWELFPQAAIGVVVVKGMKPAAQILQEDVDAIAALLDRANIDAERHLTSDTISENAPVKAWREAYRLFKTKKGARCSVENLLKRVLKGKPVGHITPAVDIYNTISLTYALPVGGEDLHAIEGILRLAVTDGGDAFLPLGEEVDDPTLPGELAYIDDAGAVCRCWNWRDGVRIINVGKLTRQRRVIRILTERQERVAAVGHRQAQNALNSMQILTTNGQRIGQRNRVVDIHRRGNVANRLAFEHALEQILD